MRAIVAGMVRWDKLLEQIVSGRSDNNIPFGPLRNLLLNLGFRERIRGDHHIFGREGVVEILNLSTASLRSRTMETDAR
ncbi:MAG TPA: hypothetical protein VN851_08055, partial [Thermoanaerobaculia bacterium]|nr:hypothetical protein [Thermoanaerobaculia bacterium]